MKGNENIELHKINLIPLHASLQDTQNITSSPSSETPPKRLFPGSETKRGGRMSSGNIVYIVKEEKATKNLSIVERSGIIS